MLQAANCDGVALDAFAFVEDRLGSAKVELALLWQISRFSEPVGIPESIFQ